MTCNFYGHIPSQKIHASFMNHDITPPELYRLLSSIWCEYSCTPRLRHLWTPDNPTLGQCSITAFLAQDIFGGKVLGILRPEGNYHCFNEVDGVVFDLTSEQFGDEVLDYSHADEQDRQEHFARKDKLERYEYLKAELLRRNEAGKLKDAVHGKEHV